MSEFFTPEKNVSVDVPYYEDVKSEDGWQGQTTSKSIKTLQGEIISALSRLGGLVSGFQKGSFAFGNKKRDGFRIFYSKEVNGRFIPGRIDIAALPLRDQNNVIKREKSLRMALYMFRDAMDGMWFLEQLSPGLDTLVPYMLVDGENTLSQKWMLDGANSNKFLSEITSETIEGETREIE